MFRFVSVHYHMHASFHSGWCYVTESSRCAPKGEAAGMQPPSHIEIKSTDFVDTMISKVLRDLTFSLNQPLKSARDLYIGILKHKIKTLGCL